MTPDWSDVGVSTPIAAGGLTSGTLMSLAALPMSASTDTSTPGAIAVPKYSPCALTAPKVVAVPNWTTIMGAPYFATAPIPPAMRHAPSSDAWRVFTGTGVWG